MKGFVKIREGECPDCGDFLTANVVENNDVSTFKDVNLIVEYMCVDCCVKIIYKYPTESFVTKVHNELRQGLNNDHPRP